jgi:CRP-like cAMP-binding protein
LTLHPARFRQARRTPIVPLAAPADAHRLLARLASMAPLTADERRALLELPMRVAELRPDQDVVRAGDRPSRAFLLIEGLAASFKLTSEGRRLSIALHVPGDVPDLQSLHLTSLDTSVATITPCRIGFIYHEDLNALCDRWSGLRGALWRATLVDAAIAREWMVGLGQQDAFARLAHLFCEVLVRLEAVGLARDHACAWPVTQVELGDLVGLSTVHVNRTIRDLRAAGLISLTGARLKALDWPRLQEAGEFDPAYLHLDAPRIEAAPSS